MRPHHSQMPGFRAHKSLLFICIWLWIATTAGATETASVLYAQGAVGVISAEKLFDTGLDYGPKVLDTPMVKRSTPD